MNTINPLSELKDIHLPEMPSAWPPAFGWWLLLLLTLLCISWLGIRLMRFAKQRKRQQQLLAYLSQIEDKHENDDERFLSAISILLRRITLMHYPRHQVANLTGDKWLIFLDQSGKTRDFSNGPGKVLANGPYNPDSNFDRTALLATVSRWIKINSHV